MEQPIEEAIRMLICTVGSSWALSQTLWSDPFMARSYERQIVFGTDCYTLPCPATIRPPAAPSLPSPTLKLTALVAAIFWSQCQSLVHPMCRNFLIIRVVKPGLRQPCFSLGSDASLGVQLDLSPMLMPINLAVYWLLMILLGFWLRRNSWSVTVEFCMVLVRHFIWCVVETADSGTCSVTFSLGRIGIKMRETNRKAGIKTSEQL